MGRDDRRPRGDSEWHGSYDASLIQQVYAGLSFKIAIYFPSNYPYTAPTIKFETPCYHPNVDIASGAICLDILQVSSVSGR